MTDAPYRDADEQAPRTLTADERSQLAAAGRRLALGAWLGSLTALVATAWVIPQIDPPTWAYAMVVPLAVLPVAWLQRARRAAASLTQLGDAGADYRGLARALGELHIAFMLRGATLLAFMTAALVLLFVGA